MTIRFTCAECASVLRINVELAGSTGRCPKCKTAFVVPEPSAEEGSASDQLPVRLVPQSLAADSKSIDHPADTAPPITNDVPESKKTAEPTLSREGPRQDAPLEDLLAKNELPLVDGKINHESEAAEKSPELSADDSHGDTDKSPSVKTPADDHLPAASPSSVDSDDNDDLDCPSMFVSSFVPQVKTTEETSEHRKFDKPRSAFEMPEPSQNAVSTSKREIPFDPSKFLPIEPVEPKHDLHPSKSDVYAVRDELDSDLRLSEDPDDPDDPGDFDEPVLTRPTPHPISRPKSKAAASRSVPEKVDLEAAAKMMKKAIKDSQAEAAHQRALEDKGGYDYFLFLREFGIRGVAVLVGGIVMTIGLFYGMDYVLGNGLKLPKLGYVSGTVTLDGKPLPNATVYFAPTEPPMINGKIHNARTSMGTTDDSGRYKMIYIDRIEGVAAGRCRVWVKHMSEKGNDVPTEWMEMAVRTEEVIPGHQKGPFDIKMETKKKK